MTQATPFDEFYNKFHYQTTDVSSMLMLSMKLHKLKRNHFNYIAKLQITLDTENGRFKNVCSWSYSRIVSFEDCILNEPTIAETTGIACKETTKCGIPLKKKKNMQNNKL